ncbi:GNAT family acetyltransferase [Boseaceae bacterium BT-24-1]|nr:GNAT family acetyltransferase [Boseaceae bacterium BT-24-1]
MTLFSRLLYSAIAGVLLLAAVLLMAVAISQTFTGFWTGEGALDTMLDGIGLVIIAVAVADVGKFLFEEEVIADRELRRPAEARGSLTKFMTIIIVALSLESLVLITKAARDKPADILFPALLMLVAVAALVGLGLFQKLSQHATAVIPDDVDDSESDEEKPLAARRVTKTTGAKKGNPINQ